jgi:hypothetical protein
MPRTLFSIGKLLSMLQNYGSIARLAIGLDIDPNTLWKRLSRQDLKIVKINDKFYLESRALE